jgi:hypothetical protein
MRLPCHPQNTRFLNDLRISPKPEKRALRSKSSALALDRTARQVGHVSVAFIGRPQAGGRPQFKLE